MLTDFYVPQTVVIRSKWLRIPELITHVFVILSFLLYHFTYRLGFLTSVGPNVEVSQWLTASGVQRNFWHCIHSKGGCEDVVPDAKSYHYCKQSGDHNASRQCRHYAWEQAVHHQYPTAVTIGTAMRHFRRVRHNDTEELKLEDEYLMPGVEYLRLVSVRIHLDEDSAPIRWDLRVPGFMKFKGEAELRSIPLMGKSNGSMTNADGRLCGGADPTTLSEGSCISFEQEAAAYFSVEVLLRAAGISPDEVRDKGTVIIIKVKFDNLEDFWSSPVGLKPKYIVTPEWAHFSSSASAPSWMVLNHFTDSASTRVSKMVGIHFILKVELNIAAFYFFPAVAKLAVISTIITLAKIFVTHVIAALYRRWQSTIHISVLRDISQFEETLSEDQVKRLLEDGLAPDMIKRSRTRYVQEAERCSSSSSSSGSEVRAR
mmetsp:Transcript_75947/g.222640  ORF Transcript_75947/g.222640 Transcript_75947/m.222640 type:complete len:429 (+) Transcript_75947:69-1355(+)